MARENNHFFAFPRIFYIDGFVLWVICNAICVAHAMSFKMIYNMLHMH